MADITKQVNRGLPANERYQVFTESDASMGDVLLVEASIHKAASRITIESVGGMSVRFNVYQTIYPQRKPNDGLDSDAMGFPRINVSKGVTYKDSEGSVMIIASGGTLEFNDDMPISDIEIVSLVGAFTITCI